MPPKRARLAPAGPPTSNKRRRSLRNDRTAPSRPLGYQESRCPRMRAPSDRNLPTSEDGLAVNTEDEPVVKAGDEPAVKAEDEPMIKVEVELAVKTENEPHEPAVNDRNAAAVNANNSTAAAIAPVSPPIATVAAKPRPRRTSAEVKGLLKAILGRYDNFLREEAQTMAELAELLNTVEE